MGYSVPYDCQTSQVSLHLAWSDGTLARLGWNPCQEPLCVNDINGKARRYSTLLRDAPCIPYLLDIAEVTGYIVYLYNGLRWPAGEQITGLVLCFPNKSGVTTPTSEGWNACSAGVAHEPRTLIRRPRDSLAVILLHYFAPTVVNVLLQFSKENKV